MREVLCPSEFQRGTFEERLNRFLVSVRVEGKTERAHLPNSGRLKELLVRGRRVLLVPSRSRGRKTPFDLWGVEGDRGWVCVDSRMANNLFVRALRSGLIPEFRGDEEVEREVTLSGRRIDFLLRQGGKGYWVEVKSVTLVKGDLALFPDAPTQRGTEHLRLLTSLRERGEGAGVFFIIQRGDARAFSPNDETDPQFASSLKDAAARGVLVGAISFQVGRGWIGEGRRVPITWPR